ncbi:MAG: DNA replication/repair protein RecF [Candidatus Eremiobacteraeota bacterium]|nr:DNA replication/repair protein RecF [Candidatus Eremiobacteraeota bacterium]MBV8497852.1 DNA replication/repair protein RecF [Candidatus Eremiobacteraeota bacterium]
MYLRRLGFSNFRNYSELNLEPSTGLNLFVGANAQGKSNLLEGIAMLGTGKSFRTARDSDAVRAGCERAVLSGEATSRAGNVNLACAIDRGPRGTRKTYTVNASPVRYANYLGRIRVVTFVPADLKLAAGTPGARRAFLNIALAQTEPRYYYELARYRKALQQKNAVLRGAVEPDDELLLVYERTLLAAGTEIMLARVRLVDELAHGAAAAHARFAPDEALEVRYEPNVVFDAATPEAIAAAFEARMRHAAESERTRKSALVGPHRDDVGLSLDGVSLAAYGSQGQQRTAVLALKVAEYGVMRERSNEAPLLLLDDVLSELDETRAGAFLGEIGDYEQAFVTATHLPPGLSGARVARVQNARVLEWAAC